MSSTEHQVVDKLLTPKSKAMKEVATSASICAGLNSPYRAMALQYLEKLRKEQEGKTDALSDKENTLLNFSVDELADDDSSLLDSLGGFDYGDGYDDVSLIAGTPLAELKDQSDESDDDKKAETDDDSDLEKTATHQDSVDSDTDDEPEKKEKTPKKKKEPMIETQVGAGLRSNVTKVLADEGIPKGSYREKTGFKIGKKTLKVSKRPQTRRDREKGLQRYQGDITMRFFYTAQDNSNKKKTAQNSSELKL